MAPYAFNIFLPHEAEKRVTKLNDEGEVQRSIQAFYDVIL